ncbi:MAG TPA: acyltransferase family protein [Acidimicrobiales bacterium]|nr:acyltransferase family protein [Acidimicrobiales bacterium]
MHVAPVESPGPDERLRFRRDVQGLRTVAVVLVVIYHSGVGLPGGFLGVDVFFVISGFVIGRLLVAELESTGTIALGRFYARRIRRLLPALAAVLIFVALFSVVATSPLGDLRRTIAQVGVGAAFYVANFALLIYQTNGYFDLDATSNPLLHTWTLAVEEQFYLVFPLLLLGMGRIFGRGRRARRAIVAGISVLALASFVLGAMLSGSVAFGTGDLVTRARLAFYSSPTRAWEFLVGVLVALGGSTIGRVGPRFAAALGVVGLAAIVGAGMWIDEASPTPGVTTLLPVAGAALVIVAGEHHAHRVARILSSAPAVWIGDRSYGWYLWHWPFMVFAQFSFPTMSTWAVLAVGVAALIPTEISYRYLEQPIRRSPGWSGRRVGRLAAACSGVAALFLLALWMLPAVSSPGIAQIERSRRPAVELPRSCLSLQRLDDQGSEVHCTWTVPNPRGKIVFVGDSHAGALASVMASVATRSGYELSIAYRPGCPFAAVDRIYDDRRQTAACRQFVDATVDKIVLGDPDLVVLASRETLYVRPDTFALRYSVTGEIGRTGPAKAEIWQEGLAHTLQRFSKRGIPSVVVATVPQLPSFDLDLCPAWRLWIRPTSCARTASRASVDDLRRAGLTSTRHAVESVPRAQLVDFADDLCLPHTCSTFRDGWWLYTDANHVSQYGASTLAPRIEAEVLPAVRAHGDEH